MTDQNLCTPFRVRFSARKLCDLLGPYNFLGSRSANNLHSARGLRIACGLVGLLSFFSLLAAPPAQAGRMKEIDLLVREALWDHFCGDIDERSWKLGWSDALSDCHFLVEALATDVDLDPDLSTSSAQALVCLIKAESGFFQVQWVQSTPLPNCRSL